MKSYMTIMSAMITFLTATVFADIKSDFQSIQIIVSSPNVLAKVKPNQTLQSIVRKGESFDILLVNSDGSCEKYNAMVLGQISSSGSVSFQTEIDATASVCN